MKKRIAALVTAGVLALSMLTGCGSKQESWKVTCPWAPSGVAAMVSQKAAAKSPDYSDNKITLVAEAVKGDAATVNTWVSSTKANDKELVFAGEGLFAITETLDPAKLQFSYDDFEFAPTARHPDCNAGRWCHPSRCRNVHHTHRTTGHVPGRPRPDNALQCTFSDFPMPGLWMMI